MAVAYVNNAGAPLKIGGLDGSFKGTWDNATQYIAGDIVLHNGSTWGASSLPAVADEPGVAGAWAELAASGGGGALGDLSDVTIQGLADDDILIQRGVPSYATTTNPILGATKTSSATGFGSVATLDLNDGSSHRLDGVGATVMWDFGTPRTICGVRFETHHTKTPTEIRVEYADDPSGPWAVVGTYPGLGKSQTYNFTFDDITESHRYWRYYQVGHIYEGGELDYFWWFETDVTIGESQFINTPISDVASQPGHTHTEADVSDLGSYPDATGQVANKIAQTDGADGWTFVDPPTGGGSSGGTTTIGPGDWIDSTLQNSWTSQFTSIYGAVGYRKDSFGNVYLRGLMGGGTVGQPAFTLPVGFRPATDFVFEVLSEIGRVRLDVKADGTVTQQSSGGAWTALTDGISFLSADAAPITVGGGASAPSVSIPTFTATHAAGVGTLAWYNDTADTVTITGLRVTLSAAAVDAATVVDVNVDGTTALAAPVEVAVGQTTSGKTVDEIVVPAGSALTVDVDSVGTPSVGETVLVQFYT